jgi:exodeoxyribonuclease VII large subunit
MDEPLLTVTELTRKIKLTLEADFPSILLQGEVSNFKRHTSGHVYFTLKDEGAQIAAVLWRSRASTLSFLPQDGMKVVVRGRITVYEPRGSYQIDVSSMRPFGVGELQLAFEKLKQKLAAEGLFDASHKRPLPEFPRRIGIVTSPTGAALHDMIQIIGRRFPLVDLILSPVRVQGAGAAEEIASTIRQFNEYGQVDLLIVGRGGGSLEDLWAFNEEIVARAIYASRIPVVSAVGHEVDFTIADFVADVRAPTPSAAAEIVVPDRDVLLETLRRNWYRMHDEVGQIVRGHREQVQHIVQSYAFNRPVDLLRQFNQRVDELDRAMASSASHLFALLKARCTSLGQRMSALDPQLTLKRGYVLVSKDGVTVSSAARLQTNDAIALRFHDGTVQSTVD